jgi:hypothetical protein
MVPDVINELANLDQVDLGMGVGELEALVATGEQSKEPHHLSPHWADALTEYLNEHQMADAISVVTDAYFVVSNASIKGVVTQVRTALAELIADLVSLTPDGQEVPTQIAADQAIQFILTGERPTINHITQRTGGGTNVAAPSAQSVVTASGAGTAIGSQTASAENSSIAGVQSVHGDNATVAGRDSAPQTLPENKRGFWARRFKRDL